MIDSSRLAITVHQLCTASLGNRQSICLLDFVAASPTLLLSNFHANVSWKQDKETEINSFNHIEYDARLVDIWACGIVYYCLHFQELPWRVAQTSDPLYAAYVSACASSNTAQSSCPPTINNLSPRACRPLIRKMLEPDPKLRWTIEEAIKFPWVESIEVCHAVSKPSHVHVYARALAREAGLQEDHMWCFTLATI